MTARSLAAVLGFLAVALGAFGAHALRDLMTPEQSGWWSTAVLYHLVHAAAVLGSDRGDGSRSAMREATGTVPTSGSAARGGEQPPREVPRTASAASWCFAAGIAVFSGTLYAMGLGGPRWLGAVTPFGGAALLAGWLLLLRPRRAPTL